MGSYEILPHTADVRLKVRGETLEELFKQAVLGMGEILKHNANTTNINANDANNLKIKLGSIDITSLLIDFLNEILLKSQINKCIYNISGFKFQDSRQGRGSPQAASLEAELIGYPIDSFDEDIKAVTYHEAEIKKNKGGNFETIIIFDI